MLMIWGREHFFLIRQLSKFWVLGREECFLFRQLGNLDFGTRAIFPDQAAMEIRHFRM